MKTIIFAALMSITGLSAQPISIFQESIFNPAVPFRKGTVFSFVVKSVTSSKTGSGGFVPNVAIPPGIPEYKVGDKIRFSITTLKQLKWADRTLPLYGDYDDLIAYKKFPTVKKPYPDVASIYVNAKNKPIRAELSFYKKKTSGDIHSVVYELD